MTFKPIDAKRDEFRKYLERSGVLGAISKVFIKLFECQDWPEDAMEFVRRNLGDTMHEADTIEYLKKELEDRQNEIEILQKQLDQLRLKQNDQNISNNIEVVKEEPAETISENEHISNTVDLKSSVNETPSKPSNETTETVVETVNIEANTATTTTATITGTIVTDTAAATGTSSNISNSTVEKTESERQKLTEEN